MKGTLAAALAALALLCLPVLMASAQEQPDLLKTSLHYTTHGMAFWYDAQDGFSAVTGVPYKDLGCKNCHVSSCNDCHLQKNGDSYEFSRAKARESATCLKCHARESATLGIDKSRKFESVHMGMLECADCHTAREVHGDGKQYTSMREPGAMDADCGNCHAPDSVEYPPVPRTRSHTVHKDKLACNACHVQNTMACYNCHFGVLKETGKKSESFTSKVKDFLLLVKYQGKVTSGTLQTLVGVDNYPFITYVPYFTHSVTPEGRKCEACHNTEAVKVMAEGKTFAPGGRDTASGFYEGVIPVAPERLEWPFYEKKDGKWVAYTPENEPLVQMGVYAEPLTEAEIKKMNMPFKYERQTASSAAK